MWAVGVLGYVLLSGLSPFAGENDIETLKNVKACDWDFDTDAFANVSDEGKDFIKRLLVKIKEKRMTAHECLEHPWLKGDHSDRTKEIPASRYTKIRDKIRSKYSNWDSFLLPIGRLSEYSSLRKMLLDKYKISDTSFDRRQAAPRFVIKPQSAFAYEGQSVKFTCRVIAIAAPTLSWYHQNEELKQSVKYMKRYAGEDYTFVINRCKLDDRGEYIIRAENHYGSREEVVFLNVQPLPKVVPEYKPEAAPIRRREPAPMYWVEEKESAPSFTFLLRPRVMQSRDTCKLLCCVSGKPPPTVKWFKEKRELSKYEYTMSHSDGVVSMEIVDCKPSDSGKYRCVATNKHGTDETSCVVIVESPTTSNPENEAMAKNILHSGERRFIEQPLRPAPMEVTIRTNIQGDTVTTQTTSHNPSSIGNTTIGANKDHTETTTDKRVIKKYGSKLDTTGSPSRSRSATKELILPPDDSLMCPPSFTTKLQDRTVNDGEPLSLNCAIKGDPDPQVSWLKNGQPLASSDSIDLKYKGGIATLAINEVFPEDEGSYTCKATNTMGTAETTCKLSVKPMTPGSKQGSKSDDKAPHIVDHLSSQFVEDGKPVVLTCRIIGAKKFDVVWLHNNKEIKPSKDFEYTNEANIYKLNIAEIFPEDSGTYTCEAFNDQGESFSSCTLTVVVPNEEKKSPVFKTFPRSTTVTEGEAATFTCDFEKKPEKVTWLKDGNPVDEASPLYTFEYDGKKKYKFSIKKCSSTDVGQYVAKASGKKGETMAAFALNVAAPGEL